MVYRARDSTVPDMSSPDIAASPPTRREETVRIAMLLAFAGASLVAYAWIAYSAMINTLANLVPLRIHGTAGGWTQAARFVPFIFAFIAGVALGVSVAALLIVFLRCKVLRDEGRR